MRFVFNSLKFLIWDTTSKRSKHCHFPVLKFAPVITEIEPVLEIIKRQWHRGRAYEKICLPSLSIRKIGNDSIWLDEVGVW